MRGRVMGRSGEAGRRRQSGSAERGSGGGLRCAGRASVARPPCAAGRCADASTDAQTAPPSLRGCCSAAARIDGNVPAALRLLRGPGAPAVRAAGAVLTRQRVPDRTACAGGRRSGRAAARSEAAVAGTLRCVRCAGRGRRTPLRTAMQAEVLSGGVAERVLLHLRVPAAGARRRDAQQRETGPGGALMGGAWDEVT